MTIGCRRPTSPIDVTSNFVVRLAAARVMARPQLGNLSPGGSINTTGQLSITTGNPLLDPFRATTLDASFEWYFAPESLISVGLFYKDIGTFIQTLRTEIPFNQTGLPLSLLPANFTGNELFLVTAPINTEGGPLKGFEINLPAAVPLPAAGRCAISARSSTSPMSNRRSTM